MGVFWCKNVASFLELIGKLHRDQNKDTVKCFGAKKVKGKWLLHGFLTTPVCKESQKPLELNNKNTIAHILFGLNTTILYVIYLYKHISF